MGFLQSYVRHGGRHGETRLNEQSEARKSIEVASPAQAAAAVKAAAALNLPVLLISAESAAESAGPAWFAHLVKNAQAPFPNCDVVAMLDCGDSPGHALAALREGLRALRFNGPTFHKIADIAKQYDALLVETRPLSLALNKFRQDDDSLNAACRDWLKD
jgi:fructose/tagatose bisphosphate aldolase